MKTLLKTVLIFLVIVTTFIYEILITSDIPMTATTNQIITLLILCLLEILLIFTFAKQKQTITISIIILLIFISLSIVKFINITHLTIGKTYITIFIELFSLSLSFLLCVVRSFKLNNK